MNSQNIFFFSFVVAGGGASRGGGYIGAVDGEDAENIVGAADGGQVGQRAALAVCCMRRDQLLRQHEVHHARMVPWHLGNNSKPKKKIKK